MNARCNNAKSPIYKYYGGRAKNPITVCKRWKLGNPNARYNYIMDMWKFLGKRHSKNHSQHRIDNDDNYYIENMMWADKKIQVIYRRNPVVSDEIFVKIKQMVINGYRISKIAKKLKIEYGTIRCHVYKIKKELGIQICKKIVVTDEIFVKIKKMIIDRCRILEISKILGIKYSIVRYRFVGIRRCTDNLALSPNKESNRKRSHALINQPMSRRANDRRERSVYPLLYAV